MSNNTKPNVHTIVRNMIGIRGLFMSLFNVFLYRTPTPRTSKEAVQFMSRITGFGALFGGGGEEVPAEGTNLGTTKEYVQFMSRITGLGAFGDKGLKTSDLGDDIGTDAASIVAMKSMTGWSAFFNGLGFSR